MQLETANAAEADANLGRPLALSDQGEDTLRLQSACTPSLASDLSPLSPGRNWLTFKNALDDFDCDADADDPVGRSSSGRQLSKFLARGSLRERAKGLEQDAAINRTELWEVGEVPCTFEESPAGKNDSLLHFPCLITGTPKALKAIKLTKCQPDNHELSLEIDSFSQASDDLLFLAKANLELEDAFVSDIPAEHQVAVEPLELEKTEETASRRLNGYCLNILTKLHFLETSKKLAKDLRADNFSAKDLSSPSVFSLNMIDWSSKEPEKQGHEMPFPAVKRFLKTGSNIKTTYQLPGQRFSATTMNENILPRTLKEELTDPSILQTKFNQVIKAVEGKEKLSKHKQRNTFGHDDKLKHFGFRSSNNLVFSGNSETLLSALKQPADKKKEKRNICITTNDGKISYVEVTQHAKQGDLCCLPFEQSKINCAIVSAGLEGMRSATHLAAKAKTPDLFRRSVSPIDQLKPKQQHNGAQLSPGWFKKSEAVSSPIKLKPSSLTKQPLFKKAVSDNKHSAKANVDATPVKLTGSASVAQIRQANLTSKAKAGKEKTSKQQASDSQRQNPRQKVEAAIGLVAVIPKSVSRMNSTSAQRRTPGAQNAQMLDSGMPAKQSIRKSSKDKLTKLATKVYNRVVQ